jgi:hypothetical protein
LILKEFPSAFLVAVCHFLQVRKALFQFMFIMAEGSCRSMNGDKNIRFWKNMKASSAEIWKFKLNLMAVLEVQLVI